MARPELSSTQREHIAENMKERIYSTITLIAVIASLWQTSGEHSVRSACASIAGAVVALWLASLIAVRMSYRAVHGRGVSLREYRRVLFTTSGLLAPAVVPILIILLSLTSLYTLKTALLVAMITLLLSLFILSYAAGRKIYTSLSRLLVVSALEMSVGVAVIILKLAVGE